jgi:hypothetical protein
MARPDNGVVKEEWNIEKSPEAYMPTGLWIYFVNTKNPENWPIAEQLWRKCRAFQTKKRSTAS